MTCGMKCVVLGGGGFIGVNLCLALQGKIDHLRVFSRSTPTLPQLSSLEWVCGDFEDISSVSRAIEGFDTVVHLVNTVPVHVKSKPIVDIQTNVVSTLKMLDVCCDLGIKRVIFISSGGSIYGVSDIVPIPEASKTEPLTAYGVSKLTIEKYLAHYRHTRGLDYRILRVANPYGPHQTISHNYGVIAVFLEKALAGLPIEIWGDGSTIRDYVYIDDVVQSIIKAMSYEGPEHIFNIGSGRGLSLNEVVKAIENQLKRPIEVKYTSNSFGNVPVNILDISRAAKFLKWYPEFNFDVGLKKTVEWIKTQQLQSIINAPAK